MATCIRRMSLVLATYKAVETIYHRCFQARGRADAGDAGGKPARKPNKSGVAIGAALAATGLAHANAAIIRPASSPVVTFTFSYDDDGTGHFDQGAWAIYASDTTDNAGLASFSVSLSCLVAYYVDSMGQYIPDGTRPICNVSPFGYYDDGTGNGSNDQIGFTASRSPADTQPVTAAQSLGSANTMPVYGLGQTVGNLADNAAPGSTGPVGTPTQPVYGAPLLLATGSYSPIGTPDPLLPGPGSGSATVFESTSGDATEAAAVVLSFTDLSDPPPASPEPGAGEPPVPEPGSLGLLLLGGLPLLARRRRRITPAHMIEPLERRTLLSCGGYTAEPACVPYVPDLDQDGGSTGVEPASVGSPFSPTEIDQAYGAGNISFNSASGNGSGQTIAIV